MSQTPYSNGVFTIQKRTRKNGFFFLSFKLVKQLFQFFNFLFPIGIGSERLDNTRLQMRFQNIAFHRPDSRTDRPQLYQDFRAIAPFLNHPLHPFQLPRNPIQPCQFFAVVGMPFWHVSVHHLSLNGRNSCRRTSHAHRNGIRCRSRSPRDIGSFRRTGESRHKYSCHRRYSSDFYIWDYYSFSFSTPSKIPP